MTGFTPYFVLEGDAYFFVVVADIGAASNLGVGLLETATEQGFGAANGGGIKKQADVGCETEAAGVGKPLSIDHEKIGGVDEFGGRGRGASRKVSRPGDIGEIECSRGCLRFNNFKLRETQYDCDGGGGVRCAVDCNIQSGDKVDMGQLVFRGYLAAKLRLELQGGSSTHLPIMQVTDFHGLIIVKARRSGNLESSVIGD